jgi:opacity protein-like surface antigen
MSPLFKKLNFKSSTTVLLLNAPDSFAFEQELMIEETQFCSDENAITRIDFVLVFVTQLQEIEDAISSIYSKLNGDALVWFCYPKGTSKKYKCEFNRDNGWAVLGGLGFEPVRMVAIDADWSALRFRKTEYIKTLARRNSFAISNEGKERTKKQ